MDVQVWLRSLGLEQYAQKFRDQAVDRSLLASLTDDDLRNLGIDLVRHRRKLLDAIAELKRDATPSEADRRQLTVLCWDLVGSTELNSRLDPEDMGHLMCSIQTAVAASVKRLQGYVARLTGDGALIYFGYPLAREDAAECAVRAGLDIVEAVSAVGREWRIALKVRVGIATSSVVVGRLLGEGSAQERSVVGEAPNLAARLQTLANPNTVVVGPATKSLLGARFELEDMGPQILKGFANPVFAWSVLREGAHISRFEAARAEGATPLIGREHELSLLVRHWRFACEGDGQVVLLSGEAGIGKSRLAQALLEEICGQLHTLVRYQCFAHQANQPFYPVLGYIWYAAGFVPGEPPRSRLDKLEAMVAQSQLDPAKLPYLAELLSIPTEGRYAPINLPPSDIKERTITTLISLLVGLASNAPVLFLLEDAHWADPSTLELLTQAFQRLQGLRVLFLITFRPEFMPPPWTGVGQATPLSLDRLERREARYLIEAVTGGKTLPVGVVEQIIVKADGVPLFIEELTKTVVGSGQVHEECGQYVLSGPMPKLSIPATLHGSLMERLDRLGPAKEIAQIGASIGRQFPYDLVESVAQMPAPALRDALRHLIDSGLITGRKDATGPIYVFKHALIQDTAYASLLRGRRHSIHAAIARALLERGADRLDSAPEIVAHHLTAADNTLAAVRYWLRAAELALSHSANTEGARYAETGLVLVDRLAEGAERQQLEFALQVARGNAALGIKGYTTSVRWTFRSAGSH